MIKSERDACNTELLHTPTLPYTLLSNGLEGTFDVSLTSVAFIDPSPSTIWLEIALIKGVCPSIPPHRFISYKSRRFIKKIRSQVLSKFRWPSVYLLPPFSLKPARLIELFADMWLRIKCNFAYGMGRVGRNGAREIEHEIER